MIIAITLTIIFAGIALILTVIWPLVRPVRVPFVAPHTGRHVASMPRETLPRRRPLAGRAPYPVAATGELALEPLNPARPYAPPACTDAATLAMYRGDWGTMPAERIIAAELPQVIA